MNKEDIIRMAREAGLNCPVNFEANSSYAQKIERFAALVYNEGRRQALYEARNALNERFGL